MCPYKMLLCEIAEKYAIPLNSIKSTCTKYEKINMAEEK